MRTVRYLLGLAVILPLLTVGPSGSLAAEKLEKVRFGLLPAEEVVEMIRQFQGIADHVGKELNLPTEIAVSESYNALIEALAAGKLDVVYVGGGSYVSAYNKGIDVVPLVVAKAHGRTYYKSCILTQNESDVKTLSDLKGRKFAFVSPTSTSGGIGPRYYLTKNGINPEKDFSSFFYAGKHTAVLLAIMNGKVDAGSVSDSQFSRWKERGIFNFKKYDEPNSVFIGGPLRILGCQKVPGPPIVARGTLGKEMIDKLTKVLLSLPFPAIDSWRIYGAVEGFIPTSHAFFADLAAMKKMAAEMKKKAK